MTDFYFADYWKGASMDRAFRSTDNTRRDISGVKDHLTQLSTISRDSYQGWIEYFRSYYSSFNFLHNWATLPLCRRCRRRRKIKQERLRAEFKNALLCSQKRMPGMKKLNAPRRAPRRHIQPNERNVVALGNGRFGNRKGQAPMPNTGLKEVCCTLRPCGWSARTQHKQNVCLRPSN
jgi:hypothetical protein